MNLVKQMARYRAKAALAWMLRALRPHAGPGPLPSARPAPFLRAVSFALLALGGALLWSAPAEAQTATVLVSNTGQTTNNDGFYPLTDASNKKAQSFTAGTNATGYTVDSVGINFRSIPDTSTAGADLRVTLNDVATGGAPGTVLCTLSDPGELLRLGRAYLRCAGNGPVSHAGGEHDLLCRD